MPYLLSLKSIAYDAQLREFFSPSHKDYMWRGDIMVAQCEECAPNGDIGLDHTCGIYSSPNPSAIKEYHIFPNSVMVLLNLYGTVDIWPGPSDLAWTYICRSWAARPVAVVTPWQGKGDTVSCLAAEQLGLIAIPWAVTKEMIRKTWARYCQIVQDPFIGGE